MGRRRPPTIHGLAVVDKPAGITSHDVVDVMRRRFGERQVGHAGTLDPDATGVLLVGVGKVTRLLRFFGGHAKTYTGEVVLGIETSTLDASGEVVATHVMDHVTIDDVARAAAGLTGAIQQVPPMVSAIHVDGQRLHELARRGIEVERAPRDVVVHRFTVGATASRSVVAVEVTCSSGTYVRSLAADLGRALGGGAHLRALRRTAIGPFAVDEARPIEQAELLAPAAALRWMSQVVVDAPTAAHVRTGRVLEAWEDAGDGPWAVVDEGGDLLAVYEAFTGRSSQVKPAVVIADPPQ